MGITEIIKYYKWRPYEFVRDQIKAKPTKQQIRILKALPEAIKKRKFIAVRSGHGIGKTCLQSWIKMWFQATRPHSRVPCTAPTQHQLYDVLWAETAKWHRQWTFNSLFEWTSTHFANKGSPKTWFAVAVTSATPDGMQGFHEAHMVFMIDESSGVDDKIFEVIQGALTTEEAICVMFGNPTKNVGFFADMFGKYRDECICFTMNAEDSEIVTKESTNKILKLCGGDRNHDMYRVRVRGLPPKDEPDTLIPLHKIEQAIENDIAGDGNHIEIGVDVARFGGDECVITTRRGYKVLNQIVIQKGDIMNTVGWVMKEMAKYPGMKIRVNVDDTGLGGGCTDRLKELNDVHGGTIIGVNMGKSAFNKKRFRNIGTELWFNLEANIDKLDLIDDPDLAIQLGSRKYKVGSNGMDDIEAKDDMKKRGLKSPDRADALSLACMSMIKTEKIGKPSFRAF